MISQEILKKIEWEYNTSVEYIQRDSHDTASIIFLNAYINEPYLFKFDYMLINEQYLKIIKYEKHKDNK